jgi:hypothetical protein
MYLWCISCPRCCTNPEQQSLKTYHGDLSALPDKSTIPAHIAEVLHLVDGAEIPKRGWVGGDSWFGSVTTAIEVIIFSLFVAFCFYYSHQVMTKFGVHTTWIIKQNQQWFPMKPFYAVLKARFKDRPAGHWVTFTTEISGIKLIAIAYAWSQR